MNERSEYANPRTTPNNIWSGSRGLLAILTNPTELAKRKGNLICGYPVTDKNSKVWVDAEAAFHAFKSKNSDAEYDEKVMIKIITAKLLQYPDLIMEISRNGGTKWLESCNHITGAKTKAYQEWEGFGTESKFIRCLIAAYEIASKIEIPY